MWIWYVYTVCFPCLVSSEVSVYIFRELRDKWLAIASTQLIFLLCQASTCVLVVNCTGGKNIWYFQTIYSVSTKLLKQTLLWPFQTQAVSDLRTRKLSSGKDLQKLKDLQAGNKKKEVSEPRNQNLKFPLLTVLRFVYCGLWEFDSTSRHPLVDDLIYYRLSSWKCTHQFCNKKLGVETHEKNTLWVILRKISQI